MIQAALRVRFPRGKGFIINELITKILVGDKHKVNGEKVQSIEIHCRFIGNLTDGGMEQVNKKSS